MGKFLSCDWGTSSFRLRLVETSRLSIIAEEASAEGISQTFDLWKQKSNRSNGRFSFYMEVIYAHIQEFEKLLGYPLHTTPLVISGMAASSIGMIELAYKDLPIAVDGSDLITKIVRDEKHSDSMTLIISGAKTNEDVMRGEETQLVGCLNQHNGFGREMVVFPGTHSKHIAVANGEAISFRTYMTGEFFDLLSNRSILSNSVEKGSGLIDEKNKRTFKMGVEESIESNLLHSSFMVRTNELFKKYTREENYHYLSGLLIGTEVKELTGLIYEKIIIVTGKMLRPYYETALRILLKGESFEVHDADEALVRGQFCMLQGATR